MKKFGLLCLAVVLALGALGIGYALWYEILYIQGTVDTGEVDWEFVPTIGEVGGDPDFNYTSWGLPAKGVITWSCPPGYEFKGIHTEAEDKDVGYPTIDPVDTDQDGDWDALIITIHDAYPYYLCDISFHIHNNGTVPIHIGTPRITQDPELLVQFLDNVGVQVHPCENLEMSFYVGVVQEAAQNGEYSFRIDLEAHQYNEPPSPGY